MADVIVKKSKIHGKGVYALRDFSKGEVVFKWDLSHKLSKGETNSIQGRDKEYVAFFDGEYILMQPPERYVNHSCDANTYADEFSDITKRDIKKGEEITGDYSENMVPGEEMICKCGNKNCRKIITSA